MRIGINGLLIANGTGYRQTGIHRYLTRLTAALPAALPDAELLVYTGRGISAPAGCTTRPALLPLSHPAVRVAWERIALPAITRRDEISLFHGTVNTLPAGLKCPAVVTVHDLALLRWPEQVPFRRFRYLSKAIQRAVELADRIIAVSTATRDDLVELLGVDPGKVAVAPLGVDRSFAPPPTDALAEFRERNGLTAPIILSVSTLEPRKNLPRLLEAFAQLAPDILHQLVLVGPEGWRAGPLGEALERLKLGSRVRLTGFVPDVDLRLWYAAADLFAFPSLYEGFGLPVLEAMACGTTVLTSNVSALPEVAGDAAILVDPSSVESIATGMRSALTDPVASSARSARGLAQAREFTWERTAALTAEVYRAVAR